jgi:type IV secretion system protein VirB1
VDVLSLAALLAACAPLVHADTGLALMRAESALNPYAIGVVGHRLERQPRTRTEALATVRSLHVRGHNFSVGLAQINVHNFRRLGLTTETAFEPCSNLTAMQAVMRECYARAAKRTQLPQHTVRKALSCYYSGNFVTGFEHGYVRRVVKAAVALRSYPTLHPTKESS